MEIIIDSSLCNKVQNIKLGFIQYEDIEVDASPQMLKGRLQLFQESIFFDLQEKSLTDIEGIKEWREIFKITGKDPNRYRHSAEALYRRIKKQNYIGTINSAIDLNNFFSLQYEVPIGIYDTDRLSGNQIQVKLGNEDETYTGLNGRENSLNNLIISNDEKGPFGSPFVDSDRAPVDSSTKNAIQIIYLKPSLSLDKANLLTTSLMDMFIQIHGGNGTFEVVSC